MIGAGTAGGCRLLPSADAERSPGAPLALVLCLALSPSRLLADQCIVGSVDTPDSARGVAVAGSFAYVADQLANPVRGDLQVIGISDPCLVRLTWPGGSAARRVTRVH